MHQKSRKSLAKEEPGFTAEDLFELMISVMTASGKRIFYEKDLDKISRYLYDHEKRHALLLGGIGFKNIGNAITCPSLLDAQSSALTFRLIEYNLMLHPAPRRILISAARAEEHCALNKRRTIQMKKILKNIGFI